MAKVRFYWRAFVEDGWPPFTGVKLTRFHWTHNERTYLGWLGKLVFRTTPSLKNDNGA